VAGPCRPWQAVAECGRLCKAMAGRVRQWQERGSPWQDVEGLGRMWQAVAGHLVGEALMRELHFIGFSLFLLCVV